jgi:uncharacterized protein YyaL (SSP411 family)
MLPKKTNHLIHEQSPYLLQHAHNPVEWYPWNEATLQIVREKDLPVLVSIGYSACHWCHVMEHESFEDPVIADFMNHYFINIKVDREERPDIDYSLMDAVQAMGFQGGWPLNVFLTPDLKPIYGGTYFPPQPVHGRPSWLQVLQAIQKSWKENRQHIEAQSNALQQHLNNLVPPSGYPLTADEDFRVIQNRMLSKADHVWGGFGRAPKFPQWSCLQYLLFSGYFLQNHDAVNHVQRTVLQLLSGGIYDQVGGGIARYSTDERWLVPHFEKMLYDNAALIDLLSDLYRVSEKEIYKLYAYKTIRFLKQELLSPEGGYYAALDADSEGEEGRFYTWDKREIEQILQHDAQAFCLDTGVTDAGNMEGKNILHFNGNLPDNLTEAFTQLHALHQKQLKAFEKLLEVRHQRIRPATDTKIILSWNAMLVTSLIKSYAAYGDDELKREAIRLFRYLVEQFEKRADGYLLHVNTGRVPVSGYLDDYAWMIKAALQLREITGEADYLLYAQKWVGFVDKHMVSDADLYGYNDCETKDIVRQYTDKYDQPVASGNSIMLENLIMLDMLYPENKYGEKASKMMEYMGEMTLKYPETFAQWAFSSLSMHLGVQEIKLELQEINIVFMDFLKIYLPIKILHFNIGGQNKLENVEKRDNKEVKITVCNKLGCLPVMGNLKEFKNFIGKNLIRNFT